MAETSRSSWRTLWSYGNTHWSKAGTGTVTVTIHHLMLHVQQVVAIIPSFHCLFVIYEVMLHSVVYQYFLNGTMLLPFVKKKKKPHNRIFLKLHTPGNLILTAAQEHTMSQSGSHQVYGNLLYLGMLSRQNCQSGEILTVDLSPVSASRVSTNAHSNVFNINIPRA